MASRGGPVLLIDDHEDARAALALVLETAGFTVVDAPSAELALARIAEGLEPGLVLLDLGLPGMSARRFEETLRAEGRRAAIPLVVLSGDGWIREKAALLGASDWIEKPVEVERLLEVVARHCARG